VAASSEDKHPRGQVVVKGSFGWEKWELTAGCVALKLLQGRSLALSFRSFCMFGPITITNEWQICCSVGGNPPPHTHSHTYTCSTDGQTDRRSKVDYEKVPKDLCFCFSLAVLVCVCLAVNADSKAIQAIISLKARHPLPIHPLCRSVSVCVCVCLRHIELTANETAANGEGRKFGLPACLHPPSAFLAL